ncbi:FAD-dependent oxidoreductase [Aporhodopirellula aestuarii]|uniref:FAD-dependent oxidoreductase n=1 Tax=Aporhodopirellula aestuarii TaxID=2950107 RepID=A0ABT0UBV2_9BACT|nr:FAD-dependent oxidoreductase [Aporhodopirellula aestuarii]MCM2374341.1 FAD-dependent oxidoreductase [Aporhodopirellula aestuarii]
MSCKQLSALILMIAMIAPAKAEQVLVEAESFDTYGGWKLDTQFIDTMGSPYLLAHGLGKPVANASTTVTFPSTGEYRVFVRTKDWVARWKAPGQPGRFEVVVNGKPISETFGTKGAEWFWHDGGVVQIDQLKTTVELNDLTGFDGRCDAILFTQDGAPPPNTSDILPGWRRERLGLKEKPTEKGGYHLVVIGGGYAGMGAAISAARMGCKVALVQNRPVLGGNGSSEIRVWAMGNIRRGKYPRIGEIVEEFSDHATKSPGTYEEFEDAEKEAIVRAEENIDLFLNHHAFQVEMDLDSIQAVHAFDTRTGEVKRFTGRFFADCTGHGTIGELAGADLEMTPKGRMGMSNMWAWGESDAAVDFPETSWALDLEMDDFPYPREHHGQWFWESGFDKDPIDGAEAIRDWNLRAVFGAFNAMKNREGADEHRTAFLTWVAYVGGPRESRRLLGDVVLTKEDVIEKRDFKDGCVPTTWSIDLHYPKEKYAEKFPDNPFISKAVHDRRIDRNYGYPVPYRCFYSRNINNLFMAGRNISVTHEALGTTRVMKTCGMMGEVVGRATSLCILHDCLPRSVYERYWDEMHELLLLPGKARRDTVDAKIEIPDDAMTAANDQGMSTGIDPASLPGIVIDDSQAKKTGPWRPSISLEGFVGASYVFSHANDNATIRFAADAPRTGKFAIRIAYRPHANCGDRVPVTVSIGDETSTVIVNMKTPPSEGVFHTVGRFEVQEGTPVAVTLATEGAGGDVHADAVQIVPVGN